MLKTLLSAAIFAAVSAAASAAMAADVTIRFPIEYSLDITPGKANAEFKRLVEERTGRTHRGASSIRAAVSTRGLIWCRPCYAAMPK